MNGDVNHGYSVGLSNSYDITHSPYTNYDYGNAYYLQSDGYIYYNDISNDIGHSYGSPDTKLSDIDNVYTTGKSGEIYGLRVVSIYSYGKIRSPSTDNTNVAYYVDSNGNVYYGNVDWLSYGPTNMHPTILWLRSPHPFNSGYAHFVLSEGNVGYISNVVGYSYGILL